MRVPEDMRDSTEAIIGAAIDVHRALGPELLAYAVCLAHEFSLRGIPFRKEVDLPISYKGVLLASSYRLDFVVAEQVVLELKAIDEFAPIHEAQLLTYLRLSGHRVGLLLNFNVPVLRDGIKRLVL